MYDFWKAVILGIVEGITEFLPISSTGHLILVNEWIGFEKNFEILFDVVIQLGAILSVIVYFWNRLYPFQPEKTQQRACLTLWSKTAVAVVPALFLGALFHKKIKLYLFNPTSVALALIVGGLLLILLEKKHHETKTTTMADLSYKHAFIIGIIQCLALIPGTSRSAATILGAMACGYSRVVAAEFSFFLAIPTMIAASAYSLYKGAGAMTLHQMEVLALGFAVAFAVAYAVIAVFIRFISHNNFLPFAYYRILLGLGILLFFLK